MDASTTAPLPMPLPKILIDRRKLRAARAALGWTQSQLSTVSGVSHGAIVQYETGQRTMTRSNLRALQAVLEKAGVRFLSAHTGVVGIEWLDDPSTPASDPKKFS